MDNTNTVCVLPWNSIAIGSTGAGFPLMVCCNSNDGTIHANNGKVATTTDLPQLYDMTFTKNLKLDLFAGVKNSLCSRCWAMEPHSFRVGLNNAYPTAHSKILSTPPGEILQKFPLEHITLNIGNTCNLACRMCYPHSSSMIEKEWSSQTVPNNKNFKLINKQPDAYNATVLGDQAFIEFVKNNNADLKSIYIYGGEPLIIIEEHLNFLQMLVDAGVSKNITLHYSTNGTNRNIRRFAEIWKEFQLVDIQISIDGFTDAYEYVRWPNTWSKIENSLRSFKELSDSKIVTVSIAATVSALTIYTLNDLLTYLKDTYDFHTLLIPVSNPDYLSLDVVPIKELISILKNWTYIDPSNQTDIKSIVTPFIERYSNMTVDQERDRKKPLYDAFVEVMQWQDAYRNQSLFDTYPQSRNWYE